MTRSHCGFQPPAGRWGCAAPAGWRLDVDTDLQWAVINLTVTVPGANKSIGDIARAVRAKFDHAATSTFGLAPPP